MNRGYDGNDIFFGHKNKNQFIDYLEDSTKKLKIRLFTYCLMDNHYHLVLENSNGRMSDCMMRLNLKGNVKEENYSFNSKIELV